MNVPERGFTLVEVLIAVLILTTGLLAVVAALGAATQMVADGRRRTRAAALAARQLAVLQGLECIALAPGRSVEGRFELDWAVEPTASQGRRIALVLRYPTPRGDVVESFGRTVLC